jgi:trafficking protein particle complex subunit 6
MAIAESCVDAVVMEMVAVYCGGLYAAKPELAARRIEAIGFQVGHQLSERYSQKQFFFSCSVLHLPNSALRFLVQTLTDDLSP